MRALFFYRHNPGKTLAVFQDAFNYIGAELVGAVYGSAGKAGEIRKNKALMKAAVDLGREMAG
jgi:hypothetical protein